MTKPRINLVHVLIIAVVAAGAYAAFGRGLTPATSPSTQEGPPRAPSTAAAARVDPAPLAHAEAPAEAPVALEGDVLEVIPVAQYTYARIGTKGTEGKWVAFPAAALRVGAHMKLRDAVKMTDFTSKTLNRSFAVIYFGVIDDAAGEHGHGSQGASAEVAGGHAETADPNGSGESVHGMAPAADVEVKKVDRAPGPNGKTVAEIILGRTDLAGKKVRLRATVVKATAGVLGKTYLHLRDGSGDAGAGTNDLSATTTAVPTVGQTVVLEGTLGLDRDIGSGYKFPTILEDAVIITP